MPQVPLYTLMVMMVTNDRSLSHVDLTTASLNIVFLFQAGNEGILSVVANMFSIPLGIMFGAPVSSYWRNRTLIITDIM
jgi:hypothetical protein